MSRTFEDFDDFWTTGLKASTFASVVSATTSDDLERLKARVQKRLSADTVGRVTYPARANAVKGCVPN